VKRALVILAVLLAGCPGNEPKDASQASPPQTTTSTAPATTTRPPMSAERSADVQLLEYQIRIPESLPAGPVHLRIANAGHEEHSFAIEGPGLSTQLGSNLMRGDTTELAVTLQAGTYTVWCPVDKHRGKGMQRTITVR
jgi:hypothetical protein